MNRQDQRLDKFREEYLDYTEGLRKDPPSTTDLGEELRPRAQAFIRSIQACRGGGGSPSPKAHDPRVAG